VSSFDVVIGKNQADIAMIVQMSAES